MPGSGASDAPHAPEPLSQNGFLLGISDALRPLSDPVDIQDAVTRQAMTAFGADRCYYCEIIGETAVIRRDAAQ